jgi:integrase
MQTEREFIYRKNGYVYFRAPTGKRELTPLPKDETSAQFEAIYGPLFRAAKGSNAPPEPCSRETVLKADQSRFAVGTIGWFIEEYLTAKQVNRNARANCDVMRQHRIAHAKLHTLSPQIVDQYSGEIARDHAPSTADAHTTLISNLWQFARTYECFERGEKHNPTIDRIRHHKADPDGHLAWTEEAIDRFDARAIAERPDLYRYRMGLHYTGQRGGDVVAMKWADYNRGKIFVMQEKTGERVWVACPAPLRTMLDAMPRVSEFIFTNSRGNPFGTANTLSTALRTLLRKCGFTDYSMHGLRKNAGMELALAGCNPNEIMAILGHRSPKMAMFYCAQASKIKLAETASAKWDAHLMKEAALREADKLERTMARRRSIKVVG